MHGLLNCYKVCWTNYAQSINPDPAPSALLVVNDHQEGEHSPGFSPHQTVSLLFELYGSGIIQDGGCHTGCFMLGRLIHVVG